MREKDILYQRGPYWMRAGKDGICSVYFVMRDGVTHANTESAYARTPDGWTIAKARVDYLGRNHPVFAK